MVKHFPRCITVYFFKTLLGTSQDGYCLHLQKKHSIGCSSKLAIKNYLITSLARHFGSMYFRIGITCFNLQTTVQYTVCKQTIRTILLQVLLTLYQVRHTWVLMRSQKEHCIQCRQQFAFTIPFSHLVKHFSYTYHRMGMIQIHLQNTEQHPV